MEVRKIYRKVSLILCCLLFPLLIFGCTMKYDYTTDEPFLITSWYPAGADDYRNMYDKNISIDHSGNLILYTTAKDDQLRIGNNAPVLEIQLDDNQVNHVKNIIQEQKFWRLPEDVSTPSEDGSFSYIIVNLTDKSKKVGGLNTDHPRFIEIRKYILSLVDDDDFMRWTEDIEEHIWEMNSLHSNNKTDYSMDDPFLLLSIEHIWADSSLNLYHHNISIDVDGNLVLFADEEKNVVIGEDAPVLNMQLKSEELEKMKELIQTHFWKLNVFIRNVDSSGGNMESITVNLADEAKRVRGAEPDHPRFVTIRNYIIDLVEEEDYKAWTKELEEHITELNPDL